MSATGDLDLVQYLNGLADTAPHAAAAAIGLAQARKHVEITRTACARLAHQSASLMRAVDDPRYGACRVTLSCAAEEVAFSTEGQLGYVVPGPAGEIRPELVADNGEAERILSELADAVSVASAAMRGIADADAAHMSAIGRLQGAAPSQREEAQADLDAATSALEAARDAARPLVGAQLVRAREVIRPLADAAESRAPGSGTFFSPEPGADCVATCRALDALYRAHTSETLVMCRALVEGFAA